MGSESPVSKLEELCASGSLSLETLRVATAQIPPADERLRSSRFLHHACLNDKVTLDYKFSEQDGYQCPSYPLHLACYNPACPSTAIELLVKKNPAALRLMNYPLEGLELDQISYDRYGFDNWAEGLPLHYYLRKRYHIDLRTVMLMVNEYPEALTTTHREGEISAEKISPFHALLMNTNADNVYKIVQHLIGAGLPGLDLCDSSHRHPLDIACANKNMDPKVVELLLKTWPASTRNVRLHDGEPWGSAIETICETQEGNRAAEILRLLVDADPPGPEHRRLWGDYDPIMPLHWAALNNQSPEFCKHLVGMFPNAAKDDIVGGIGTPLLNACICNPSNRLDTVQYLFDVYPEAIEMVQSTTGRTPLEVAVSQRESDTVDKQANERVISFLETQLKYVQMARDVEALATRNFGGRLPLHYALLNGASLGSVILLEKGHPAAVQVADDRGTFPLHIACEFCTADIVRFLVDHSQSSYWDRWDTNGNYPLHLACRGANFGVVQYLLEETSSPAVSERNGDDKLPIQLLCESHDKNVDRQSPKYVETILLLLLAYPETVLHFE